MKNKKKKERKRRTKLVACFDSTGRKTVNNMGRNLRREEAVEKEEMEKGKVGECLEG